MASNLDGRFQQFGGSAVNKVVGLAIGLLGVGLVGCSSQAAPRKPTSVVPEANTKVQVDEQGNSQVSGPAAPQAPAEPAK